MSVDISSGFINLEIDPNIDLVKEIETLKREKSVVILAHYYTRAEVQQVADFVGDSLALSQQAAATDAKIILFAGVHFMATTAKILSPQKKVLIPDLNAGCSLADSCGVEEFRAFKALYPHHKVVSYINTSVGIKALTDVACTSSNCIKIINSFPADQPLIFAPDRNLGNYIKSVTGRENIVVWDGACHVHEQFSLEKILELKIQNPNAKIVTHPECKKPILMVSDFVGSTAAIIEFCGSSSAQQFIVVTESGILHELQRRFPNKQFIPAPPADSTCACNDCQYMKLITLKKIYLTLLYETPEVTVDESVRLLALNSIEKMLEHS